jgi:hypothetical protein
MNDSDIRLMMGCLVYALFGIQLAAKMRLSSSVYLFLTVAMWPAVLIVVFIFPRRKTVKIIYTITEDKVVVEDAKKFNTGKFDKALGLKTKRRKS